MYTTKQATEFINLQQQHSVFQSQECCIYRSNKTLFVEICATHHEATLSALITETATNITNYANHIHCTILYSTLMKSLLSKIQQ